METATIEFEEYPGDEFVVRIAPVPGDVYWALGAETPWSADGFASLAERFAPFLVSWTLDLPATAEGLMKIDPNLLVGLRNQWFGAVFRAPVPLRRRPSAGGPLEPVPENPSQPSSPEPSSTTAS